MSLLPSRVCPLALRARPGRLKAPTGLLRWYADQRFPDVAKYSRLGYSRAKVLDRVGGALREIDAPVVIAHSLGTVVALDALAALDEKERPRLLVTAGNPLGQPNLFRTYPACVANTDMLWLNLIDPTDEVTGGRLLHERLIPGALNFRVNNDKYSKWIGKGGGWVATHHIRHYLSHPVTARLLAQLQRDPYCSHQELLMLIEQSSADRSSGATGRP